MKRLLSLVTVLAVAGCGAPKYDDKNGDGVGDPTDPRNVDSVTMVAPTSPKGRISGRIQNLRGEGLTGVEITVSGPTPTKAQSAENGLFAVEKLTAGSNVGVLFSMANYAPAWTYTTVPAAAGNFPLNDGESFIGVITLMPTDGELSFNVVGFDGKPISLPKVTLDVTPAYAISRNNNTNGYGDIPVTAELKDGVVKFTGIPKFEEVASAENMNVNVRYSLYIPPVWDEAAKVYTYGGYTSSVAAKDLLQYPHEKRTIVLKLPQQTAPLAIEATNVRNLVAASPARENLISPNGPIYVAFNQPIGKEVFVEVRNEEAEPGKSAVISINTPELNALGTELRITPKTPGFQAGMKYNLTIQAFSRDDYAATSTTFTGPFFGGEPGTSRPLAMSSVTLKDNLVNDKWDPSETLVFLFDKYIGGNPAEKVALPVYFNTNLGGTNDIGDFPGEKCDLDEKADCVNTPICVVGSEMLPPVPGKLSKYSRKFELSGTGKFTTPIDSNDIEPIVVFQEAYKCNGPLHNVWGEALTTTIEGLSITVEEP